VPCRQTELGTRVDRRGTSGGAAAARTTITGCGKVREGAWQDDRSRRAACTHRRIKRAYKTRVRPCPQLLDSALADIESWLAAEPQLTAIAYPRAAEQRGAGGVRSTATLDRPEALKTLRTKAAHQLIAGKVKFDKVSDARVVRPGLQRASSRPIAPPGNISS